MYLNELEFAEAYFRFSAIISSMQEKVVAAKLKNPSADYSEAWEKVDSLNKIQTQFEQMYKYQKVIDQQNFRITKQFHIMDDKIKRLEKEIETLKKAQEF